MMTQLGMS